MGSITPLLDTLLHQVLGRQLALDSHARQQQPQGPSAISAILRDGAADDATSPANKGAAEAASSLEGEAFAENVAAARAAQRSPNAAREEHRSGGEGERSSSPVSAQLALSDAARELSARERLALQQALLSELASLGDADDAALSPSGTPFDLPLRDGSFSPTAKAQPSILLPLPDPYFRDMAEADVLRALALSDSFAHLELSAAARQMGRWIAVLSQSDWQALLKADADITLPLPVSVAAPGVDSAHTSSVPLEERRDALMAQLSTALKTSGIFHEALLVQWSRGDLPQALVEQSAQHRQQLVNLLPAAPDFGDSVIRQQLQLMAGQSVHFQSELWAGAMMMMSFRTQPFADTAAFNGGADRRFPAFFDQRRVWTLTLTFELSRLGRVMVDVQWDGDHLSVTLNAEHASTRELLQAHQAQLEALLNNNDTLPASIQLSSDAPDRET